MQSALQGCRNTDVRDSKAFATAYIQAKRPRARITNAKGLTEAEYAQLQGVVPPLPPTGDPSTRQRAEANGVTVRLTYTENGQSFDEVAFVGWITVHTVSDPIMGMGGAQVHNTTVMPTFTMRAPLGQLNEARAEALYAADRPNPVHQQMTKQYHDQKARQSAQRFIAASKARMAANKMPAGGNPMSKALSDANDMSMKGYNDRNASTSYGQTGTINAIRGVTTYNDPMSITGTAEQNIGSGQYMYRMNDGSYVSTDNPSLMNGTRLEPNR
jgi:hypothetical protein